MSGEVADVGEAGLPRWSRLAITVAVLAALFVPVGLDRDDFPLSTYPMYASTRGSAVSFVTAQGVDATGARHVLSLDTIGGSDDPLIVAGELRAAIRDGRAGRRCEEIAGRVAADSGAGTDWALVAIEVVTERHDVVDRVADRASLVERAVHASCPVEAGSP